MRSVVESRRSTARTASGVDEDGLFPVNAPLSWTDYLRSLWLRRDFIIQVPLGRLKAQTHSTVLGGAWHLLNPVLSGAVYYVVFGVIFLGADAIPNYAGFLIAGLFSFLYIQRSATSGARSVIGNRNLISQVNFPRAALPISAIIAETISYMWSLIALVLIVALTGESLEWRWVLLLPVLLLQGVFNLGFAMVVARMSFHFRDIEQFLPYILRMWMYLSGIFFTVDFVARRLGESSFGVAIFQLNPAYVYAALTRSALLEAHPVAAPVWVLGVMWAVVMLVAGFIYFRGREVEYASE